MNQTQVITLGGTCLYLLRAAPFSQILMEVFKSRDAIQSVSLLAVIHFRTQSDPRVSPEAVSHTGWKSFPCLVHREDKQESQGRVHHLSGQGMGRGVNTGNFCSSTVLPCGWPRQHSIMCQSSHTFPRVSKRERLGSVSVLMMRQQFRGRQCVYCYGLLDCG